MKKFYLLLSLFGLCTAMSWAQYTVKIVGKGSDVMVAGQKVTNGQTLNDGNAQGAAANANYGVDTKVKEDDKTITFTVFVKELSALSDGKTYHIEYFEGGVKGACCVKNSAFTIADKSNPSEANQQFSLMKQGEESAYLYNAATNKYVAIQGTDVVMADAGSLFSIVNSREPNYPVSIGDANDPEDPRLRFKSDGSAYMDPWGMTYFRFIELPETLTESDLASYNAAKAKGQTYLTKYKDTKGKSWSMSAESYNAIEAAVNAATPTDKDDLNAKLQAINTAIANIKVQLPKEGEIFTLATPNAPDAKLSISGIGRPIEVSTEKSTGIYWVFVPKSDGKVEIKNVLEGHSIPTLEPDFEKNLSGGQDFDVIWQEETGSFVFTFAHYDGNKTYALHKNADGFIYAGAVDAEDSRWVITPVDGIEITPSPIGEGWATFCAPFATTIPNGVEAYTAKLSDNKEKVLLQPVNTTIPANTAVLVKGQVGVAIKFVKSVDAGTPVVDNLLVAALMGTMKPEVPGKTVYTLQKNEDFVGFYPFTGTQLKGLNAYVLRDSASPAQGLSFDLGAVTGIDAAQAEQKSTAVFDLAGRRVNKAKGGLYIVDGKKVVLQ